MRGRAAFAVVLAVVVIVLTLYLFQIRTRNSMDIHTYGTAHMTRGITPNMPTRVPIDAVAISGIAGGYGGAYDGWHRGGGGYAGFKGRGRYGGSNPDAPQKSPLMPYIEPEKEEVIESASMNM